MPVIDNTTPAMASPAAMADWKPLHRIENTGGHVSVVIQAFNTYPFQRRLYAEGDSWFDKFTPIPLSGTNLLDNLRLPCFAGVVDVSHIGDVAESMVNGWQARQTKEMFKLFEFDAILLSAGGNDLKNVFANLYHDVGEQRAGRSVESKVAHLKQAIANQPVDDYIASAVANIRKFIALRDGAGNARTRTAPLFIHGYDYLQPRPAPAVLFAGSTLGAGPWLYPSMQHAGLSDAQMLAATKAVIDGLNDGLRTMVTTLPPTANVWMLDQRGLLVPGAAGSTGVSNDWMDEIHATSGGYEKLTKARWNPALAKAMNLI